MHFIDEMIPETRRVATAMWHPLFLSYCGSETSINES